MKLYFLPLLLVKFTCFFQCIALLTPTFLSVFKIHDHQSCDVDSSRSPSYGARRVKNMFQKFMSYFAKTPVDHELPEHRNCPKVDDAGTEPDANVSVAVIEEFPLHLQHYLR